MNTFNYFLKFKYWPPRITQIIKAKNKLIGVKFFKYEVG